MKRRAILSIIVMTCAMTVMMVAGGDTAIAQQNPNCCSYTVLVSAIPPNCLPITLTCQWDCDPHITSKVYNANGTFIEPIGSPTMPPCPPACHLHAISIDNVQFTAPGQTRRYVINGCCYTLDFGFDANNCIMIKIARC